MGLDPQKDWSEDGACPRCGGYAIVAGNDDWPTMSYDCEAGCRVGPRPWPGYRPPQFPDKAAGPRKLFPGN